MGLSLYCLCLAAHDGHLVWPGMGGWEHAQHMPSSLAFCRSFFAVAGGLLMLGPLISDLVVFAPFLSAIGKFEWCWSAGRLFAWFVGGNHQGGFEDALFRISRVAGPVTETDVKLQSGKHDFYLAVLFIVVLIGGSFGIFALLIVLSL